MHGILMNFFLNIPHDFISRLYFVKFILYIYQLLINVHNMYNCLGYFGYSVINSDSI